MLSSEKIKGAIETLQAQLLLPEREATELFRRATDERYWDSLAPRSVVTEPPSPDDRGDAAWSAEQAAGAAAHLARHGYFVLPPLLAPAMTGQMRDAVEALHGAGWPAVFSYIYDPFWAVLRSPSLAGFLRAQLGAGYLQTSPVWTYRVDPRRVASGWPPHTDGDRGDARLTVWIPLSNATIENGCMYVVPRDRLPSELPYNFLESPSVPASALQGLLHNVTPLPAARGSVLGWHHDVIHWGGQANARAREPRISFAVEFLREGAEPRKSELPVFGDELPDFPTRLRVIGQAILRYQKFEPLMGRYRELAARLIAWADGRNAR